MLGHKDKTVKANVDGIAFLFKKNKIEGIIGTGRIKGAGSVEVTGEDGSTQTLNAGNICIATGSEVAGIPGVEVALDEDTIVSSDYAIALQKVPATMVVVGGGVIGLELGSVWARLGAKVTVVEYLDKVPRPDGRRGVQSFPEAAGQAGAGIQARRQGRGRCEEGWRWALRSASSRWPAAKQRPSMPRWC